MGASIRTVQFACNTSTGTQDITISGFGTPKAALFFLESGTVAGTSVVDAIHSWGYTDGTTTINLFYNSKDASNKADVYCGMSSGAVLRTTTPGENTVTGSAAFSAWITDGIRINWTDAPPSAFLVNVILFGGSDLSAYVGSTSTGTGVGAATDITSVGFEADFVIGTLGFRTMDFTYSERAFAEIGCAINDTGVPQFCAASLERNTRPASETAAMISSTYISRTGDNTAPSTSVNEGLEVSAFDSSGFTVTRRDSASYSDATFVFLAVKITGGSYKAAAFGTATATGNDATTGTGFQPDFLMIFGSWNYESNGTDHNDTGRGVSHTIGIADGTNECCTNHASQDSIGTTNVNSIADTKILNQLSEDGTSGNVATLSSFDTDGFTLNYSTANATARQFFYLAIKLPAPASPALLPSNRARHFANLLNH